MLFRTDSEHACSLRQRIEPVEISGGQIVRSEREDIEPPAAFRRKAGELFPTPCPCRLPGRKVRADQQ
jgi:hypothetical protein